MEDPENDNNFPTLGRIGLVVLILEVLKKKNVLTIILNKNLLILIDNDTFLLPTFL